MTNRGFSQAWESSQHLSAARLEADIAWLISCIGNPTTKLRTSDDSVLPQTALQPLSTRLRDAFRLPFTTK